jgi:hypothetical protein
MAAEAEAKQLDSVTDVVKEAELDASKAQEAMTALATAKKEDGGKVAALAAVTILKDDVTLIVSELEVTEDVAERVLRDVALEANDGNILEIALRRLVTS